MNTQIYPEKKTFQKFDAKRFIIYLNEGRADYVPSASNTGMEENVEIEPVLGYSYRGTMPDGGTLIMATEASYSAFVSGLIRLLYSEDAESAIQANMMVALSEPDSERANEFREEWGAFQTFRNGCKEIAKSLLK